MATATVVDAGRQAQGWWMMARMLSQLPLPLLPAGRPRYAAAGEAGHAYSMHPARQRRGHLSGSPCSIARAAPLHLEPGHLVNATAASAAEANNCRRADLAVIHPRCCHSRSASESPAITTSPNGMER